MMFPVMDFIEKGENIDALAGTSKMWHYINVIFDFSHIPKSLLSLMVIVFCLLLSRQVFIYLKLIYSTWVTESIFSDIRSIGFKWFVKADLQFYDQYGTGQLINAITTDGIRAGGGIFSLFNLMTSLIIFGFYLILMFILSHWMTVFALGIMGCVAFILKSKIKKSAIVGGEVSKYNDIISSSIIERLNGIRLIKLAATEENEIDRIRDLSNKIKYNTYDLAKIRAKMEFVVDPIVIFAGLVILYLSAGVLKLSLAKTGMFIFILLRLMPYAKDIFKSRQVLAGFSGSLFRVVDLLGQADRHAVITGGPRDAISIQKGIRINEVSFSYHEGEGFALRDLSIFVPSGQMTALIGRSGAGKSTLVDLIPRLRVPQKGNIYFDDVPIEDYKLKILRRSIAYVSQEGYLFNDTIENNIKYCNPNATDEEVYRASKMAFAHDFINEFSSGYQTIVGERGVKLSGGQKQRIVLARALMQNAMIIILDEPTSSLDSESEQYIQKAIDRIRRESHVTFLVIAHRLSTIKSADQIIVLDKGRVVESGSHGDLMHEDSWYAGMVKMQAVG